VHPKEIHAGLGRAETVDVEIIWPGGESQRIKGLAANKRHRIQYRAQ